MIGASPTSLSATVPAYLFQEYSDDDNLQAIFGAHNAFTQGYVDWFNQINLPVYTGLTGPLLDWVCTGLYGLPRPIIPTQAGPGIGLLESYPYNSLEFNQFFTAATQTFYTVSDDIYKRILTWQFFKGDGFNFTIPWLKRRVARFLIGQNGTSAPVGTQYVDGLALPANLSNLRVSSGTYVTQDGYVLSAAPNTPRVDWTSGSPELLVETASTNYVRYSSEIGGVFWTLTGGMEVLLGRSEILAPDQTPNATLLSETTSNTQHLVQTNGANNVGVGSVITHSVYAAPSAGSGTLFMISFGENSALFDVINGIASDPGGSVISTGIQPLANGWYRCWTTWLKSSSNEGFYLGAGAGAASTRIGNPANQIYVWGAQAEFGGMSSYIPSLNATVTRAQDVIAYPTWIDQTNAVSVQVLNGQVTIKITGFAALKPLFAAAIASGVLPLPAMYTYVVE